MFSSFLRLGELQETSLNRSTSRLAARGGRRTFLLLSSFTYRKANLMHFSFASVCIHVTRSNYGLHCVVTVVCLYVHQGFVSLLVIIFVLYCGCT